MAKRDFIVDYDDEENMFSLFRKDSKTKFSFDIELPVGDIVVDFGHDGQIVGLEFFNASNYFPFLKDVGDKKINANMSVNYGKNWALIRYQVSIPGKKPISNHLISPVNRRIIATH